MTTLATVSVSVFNIAQTFFVDPGAVANAPEVSITGFDLYFQAVPKRTGNKSGIVAPGVDVFLCTTTPNGTDEVPNTSTIVKGGHVRVAYDSIVASSTAAVATPFTFPYPVNVDTGQTYALVIKFDGDEDFSLWTSVVGNNLLGTNSQTAGPVGKYVGKYFQYSYITGLNNQSSNTALNTTTSQNLTGSWKALSTTDLKFVVYVAKFTPDVFANTTIVDPVTGISTTTVVAKRSFLLYKQPYEFIDYNPLTSTSYANVFGGEVVYQNNVMRPELISVTSGSTLVTGSNVNFTSIFGNANNDKYAVFYSGIKKNVRKVVSIQSNNAMTIDIPLTFSNSAATFAKVVAGKLDLSSKVLAFGRLENMIALNSSSANSSLRFANSVVESFNINAGGTAYTNTDYLVVSGGGVAGANAEANAVANVTTNSTGGITALSMSNKGIGFHNVPNINIYAANGAASNGSSANITVNIGMTLMTEFSNATLSNCHVINLPVNTTVLGAVDLENPYGTSYYLKKHYMYYALSDGIVKLIINNAGTAYSNNDTVTFTGGGGTGASGRITTDSAGKIVATRMQVGGSGFTSTPTVVITTSGGSGANLTPIIGVARNNLNTGQTTKNVTLFNRQQLSYANTPLILSRSVEVMQPNSTFVTDTGVSVNTNISSVVEMVTTTNNVYVVADIQSSEIDVFFEKYAINNDYTNENTGQGRAVSKHISKIVNFGDDKTAEDLRLYANVYRPANTDIKVYARLFNVKDPKPFVEKDWTLLTAVAGSSLYSAAGNESDLVEITYGLPAYPNSSFTANGTATTTLSSNVVTGANSSYDTQFTAGDMIKIYSPLFPTNYNVGIVASVTNSTQIIMNSVISNNNVVGAGLLVDKIAYKNQAFNNFLNNNISRYYGANNAAFDGFNSFAVKIVFLSDNEFIVPKVANIKAIGVTA